MKWLHIYGCLSLRDWSSSSMLLHSDHSFMDCDRCWPFGFTVLSGSQIVVYVALAKKKNGLLSEEEGAMMAMNYLLIH